jgi:uncharacterized protein (TIGR02265 family)
VPAGPPPVARETSSATTAGLLRYLRAQAGDAAVARTLELAQVPHTEQDLTDPASWTSYDTRIRLFAAATEVLGDPATMFQVGATSLAAGLSPSVVLAIRAMGSPRQVIRHLPSALLKFSTTSTMEVQEAGPTWATVTLTLRAGYEHSRLDCRYAQGLLTSVPVVFGLPPARIEHDECESDGHPTCVYRLTWSPRSRLPWRRHRQLAADTELAALRGQLRALQSAATELIATQDLDTVLDRIVARAAEAVLAPAYVLAVSPPAGGPALVHSAGLSAEEARRLADVLLAGGDLGPRAVVVDVASARRAHGRLAAVYRADVRGTTDERAVLAAYAGHAAAALDLLFALDEARLEASRSGALLELAHELAATSDAGEVCEVVAGALPRVVGCTSGSVMLWDATDGFLRARAATGLDDEQHRAFLATPLSPEDTPELFGMLTEREPRVLAADTSSPALGAVMAVLDLSDVVVVPLVAGGVFLGVATASWRRGQAPAGLGGDVLARLRGVGDQAATALEKARLLEAVQHQALHDALTGLPNRALVAQRLEAHLEGAGPDAPLAVLFCDLDRFKEVNDAFGHAAGDELLRQVAARLRAVVRPGDTVGRISGDEFVLVLPDVDDLADAEGLAGRVAGCFAEPFRLAGHPVDVQASIGLAVHAEPDAGRRGEQLLTEADAAMYRAKRGARRSGGRRTGDLPR